ncbi:MAG: alpha/beta hydrolase [Thermoleophilaceae bacterium]|nr:alpha/beta hydrolase [Thermoleophilaceae bacterium]
MNSPKTPGAREPLVLLHGFGDTPHTWEPILPLLRDRYEVHTIALRGHFEAAPLPKGVKASARALADAVEADMDSAGLTTAHVVGNSLGGWLALELGARGRARSVTALAPAGGWNRRQAIEIRTGFFMIMMRVLARIGYPIRKWLLKSSRRRRMAMRDITPRGDLMTPAEAEQSMVGFLGAKIFYRLIWGELTSPLMLATPIKCPLTIAWGTADRVLPIKGCTERWLREFPTADWRLWPGVGHVPMIDAGEEVVRAIDETADRANALPAAA